MKRIVALLLCVLLLCFAGCVKKAEPMVVATATPKAAPTEEPALETPAPAPTPVAVEDTAGQLSDALLETEALAYPLIQNLKAANTDKNTVFSPVAMSDLLTALYAAADGDTGEELRQMLSWMCEKEDAVANLKVLNQSLGQNFSAVNMLFLSDRVKPAQSFLDDIASPLSVQTDSVNFSDITAAEAINAFAGNVAGEKAARLIEGTTAADMLVAASGFTFFGTFDLAFDEKETENETFEGSGGLFPCAMMEMQTLLPYAEDEYMQLVSLPMNGGKQSMVLLLPKKGMEQGFDEAFLQYADSWLSQEITKPLNVELTMPRFTLSSGLDLTEILADMGMRAALRAQTVNLEGLLDESLLLPTPISSVYSVGTLAVSEHGVNVRENENVQIAQKQESEETVEVEIDRPFMAAVTDSETGAVLVIGWVNSVE